MLMILARLVRSESFWAVVKVRSPHTGPEVSYPRHTLSLQRTRSQLTVCLQADSWPSNSTNCNWQL